MMALWNDSATKILSLVLLVQIGVFHGISREEFVPTMQPLTEFPRELGNWKMIRETPLEPAVLAELKADDTLMRDYQSEAAIANLYVAFFKTQRTGVVPHSPQHCLPANGWVKVSRGVLAVSVPNEAAPLQLNRYVVSRGQNRSLVIYWYQTPRRVIASEYWAKVYLVWDSLWSQRSDTSLVRVVVPVIDGDEATAERAAVSFIQWMAGPMRQHLPS